MTDTIVLKVPEGTKAKLIKLANGDKLADYILRQFARPNPEPWLSRHVRKEPGSVATLTEDELRDVMRRAYMAGAYRA